MNYGSFINKESRDKLYNKSIGDLAANRIAFQRSIEKRLAESSNKIQEILGTK